MTLGVLFFICSNSTPGVLFRYLFFLSAGGPSHTQSDQLNVGCGTFPTFPLVPLGFEYLVLNDASVYFHLVEIVFMKCEIIKKKISVLVILQSTKSWICACGA